MFANQDNTPRMEEQIILFDDKPRSYDGTALGAETTYAFYDRSSKEEYGLLRKMLTRWIKRLPPEKQRDIVGRMRHNGRGSLKEDQNFNAAFFELFMHEFLVGTDGYTVVDPKINGLTPDFRVTENRQDGTAIKYIVEATDIDLTRNSKLEHQWTERQVLDRLNEIESSDYFLSVQTEGTLKSTPRKERLKAPFAKLVQTADYNKIEADSHLYGATGDSMPSAKFCHGDWTITGHLMPVAREHRSEKGPFVGVESIGLDYINDIGRTKDRLYAKARRYQSVDNLIIALRDQNPVNRISEALFGTLTSTVYFHKDPTATGPVPKSHQNRERDGFWFNSSSPQNQHVIGIVVFHHLHPHCIDRTGAVFYANPYLENQPMPAWTTAITHAQYPEGRIEIVSGEPPHIFVTDHILFDSF